MAIGAGKDILARDILGLKKKFAWGNKWKNRTSALANVGDGGALAYDGVEYIYALRGGNSTDFWRYSISGNSWSAMTSALANVSYGGSLAYVAGSYIYAFGGWDSTYFWRYII